MSDHSQRRPPEQSQQHRRERFDSIVVGMGPGGEVVADRLLQAGQRVAVVERELIGGECGYWACIPSKTVLRGGEVVAESARVAGVAAATLGWDGARDYRDQMARHLDDSAQVASYEEKGAVVLKGAARMNGRGRVDVGSRTLEATAVVVATGTEPFIPTIEGLGEQASAPDRLWTNREAYTTPTLPRTAIVLGGSAVGIETAMFLVRFGVDVTVLQRGARLLGREEPAIGTLVRHHLEAAGVDVRTDVTVSRGRLTATGVELHLDDGASVAADAVVFATGRRPRTTELDLAVAGATLDDRGAVVVDERCRAADGLWAVGDVTGVMPFTHVAKYQGRIAADAILGGQRTATYEGIPRVVFADPEIAAVGLTSAQAMERGLHTVTAEVELPEALARPWTYEQEPRGRLGVLADARSGVLVGAWAVAPLAGEWIHQAALAIRARVPIDVLLDQVAQFPTYTEAYLTALEALPRN